MKDITDSLEKALIRQRWQFGDRMSRLGHPFEWVCGEQMPNFFNVRGTLAVLQYLTMYYEVYPTPKDQITSDYEQIKAHLENVLRAGYNHFVPFASAEETGFEHNIKCTALVRAQDYVFIKNFCKDLRDGINHLDIGPGLGSHAIYSREAFGSCYYGVEANPHSYAIQRQFLRFMAGGHSSYFDPIECENMYLDDQRIERELNVAGKYKLKHVPSWHFPLVADRSIDLVTATWVLNEVSSAGILWLIANSTRTLKKGGYFYIRDSFKLKPLRHQTNYDELLQELNFRQVGKLDVENRVNLFGIPRCYQKMDDSHCTFEDLVNKCLGHFAVTVHGGAYMQNLKPQKTC